LYGLQSLHCGYDAGSMMMMMMMFAGVKAKKTQNKIQVEERPKRQLQ